MGLLLRHFRKKKPDDTRSDYLVLAGYIDEYGEDWLRTRYPEDWDQFQDEIGSFRPQSTWEELKRGAVKGAHGLYGTAKGTVALGIDLIPGDTGEETSDKLLASAAESFKEASRPGLMASGAHPIASLMGQAIPSLTESIVTGVAGAAIGAAVVPAPDPTDVVTVPVGFFAGLFSRAAIKNEIKDRIVLKLGKEALEESVEKTYKKAIGKGTKKELEDAVIKYGVEQGVFNASKKLIGGVAFQKKKIAAQYASTGTVLMNSIGLSSGEIYNQLRADENVDPDTALTHALMGGIVAGTPEAIMPAFILRKAIKGIRAPRTIAATDTTYRKIVNSFPGRLAKNLGGGMATEGATEAFQAWVGIVTEKTAKGMSLNEAISDPLNYSEKKEIEHSAKAGLAAGFLGGGLSVGIDAIQRSTPADLDSFSEKDKEDISEEKVSAIQTSVAKLTAEEVAEIDMVVDGTMKLITVFDENGEPIGVQAFPSEDPFYIENVVPLLSADADPVKQSHYVTAVTLRRQELHQQVAARAEEEKTAKPTKTLKEQSESDYPTVKAIMDALYVDEVNLALKQEKEYEENYRQHYEETEEREAGERLLGFEGGEEFKKRIDALPAVGGRNVQGLLDSAKKHWPPDVIEAAQQYSNARRDLAVKQRIEEKKTVEPEVVTPAEEAVDGIDGLKKKWDRFNPDSLGKEDPNPKATKTVIVDKNQDSSWKILKTKVQAWASKGKDADEIVQKLYNEGLGIDSTGQMTRYGISEEFYQAVKAEVGSARGAKAKVVTPETTVGEPVVEGVLVKEKKGKDGGKSSKTYRTADGKFRQIVTNEDGTVFRDRTIEVVHTVDEDGTMYRHVYEFENGKVVDHTIGAVTEVITDMPPAAIGGALTEAGSANVGVAGTETGFMVGATTAAEDATSETFGGHKLYTEADPKAIAKLEKQRRDEEDKAKKIESLTVKPMDSEGLRTEFVSVAEVRSDHLKAEINKLKAETDVATDEAVGVHIIAKDPDGKIHDYDDAGVRALVASEVTGSEGWSDGVIFNQAKDILEARGFSQIERKASSYQRKTELLALKQKQLEQIEEKITLLKDEGVVEDFPIELIAFQTQEADKSFRAVDNLGNKIKDRSVTYPAFYSTNEKTDDSAAGDELKALVEEVNKEGATEDQRGEALNKLGKALTSEWVYHAPKGAEKYIKENRIKPIIVKELGEGASKEAVEEAVNKHYKDNYKAMATTRLVVLRDNNEETPPERKYQVVGIDSHEGKNKFRVALPIGQRRTKSNNNYITLEEAINRGFVPVASIRMAVPTSQFRFQMDEESYTALEGSMLSDRTNQAAGAVQLVSTTKAGETGPLLGEDESNPDVESLEVTYDEKGGFSASGAAAPTSQILIDTNEGEASVSLEEIAAVENPEDIVVESINTDEAVDAAISAVQKARQNSKRILVNTIRGLTKGDKGEISFEDIPTVPLPIALKNEVLRISKAIQDDPEVPSADALDILAEMYNPVSKHSIIKSHDVTPLMAKAARSTGGGYAEGMTAVNLEISEIIANETIQPITEDQIQGISQKAGQPTAATQQAEQGVQAAQEAKKRTTEEALANANNEGMPVTEVGLDAETTHLPLDTESTETEAGLKHQVRANEDANRTRQSERPLVPQRQNSIESGRENTKVDQGILESFVNWYDDKLKSAFSVFNFEREGLSDIEIQDRYIKGLVSLSKLIQRVEHGVFTENMPTETVEQKRAKAHTDQTIATTIKSLQKQAGTELRLSINEGMLGKASPGLSPMLEKFVKRAESHAQNQGLLGGRPLRSERPQGSIAKNTKVLGLLDVAREQVDEEYAGEDIFIALSENLGVVDGVRQDDALVTEKDAEALRKAVESSQRKDIGTDTELILEQLFLELGLVPDHEAGSNVSYNPILHQDTVGGMIPGDIAEVVSRGWLTSSHQKIRARIKPAAQSATQSDVKPEKIYHGRVPPEESLLLNLSEADEQKSWLDESQPSGWTREGWVDNSMDVALSHVRKEVGDTVEGLVKWLGVEDNPFGKLLLASEKLRNIQVHLEVYDPSSDDNKITYGRYNDEGGPSWAGVREADAGSTTLYLGEHLNKDHLWLTFKHEMLHGMFFRAVHNYETVAGENLSLPAVEHLNKLSDLLERSRRAYEEKNKTGYIDWSKFSYDGGNPSASPLYGLANLDEFISEAMSDQRFIEFLQGVPGQTKGESLFMTILGKLKELAMQLIRDLKAITGENFSESAYGETVESIIALYVETEETGRGKPIGDQMRAVVGKRVSSTLSPKVSPDLNNNAVLTTNVAVWNDISRVFKKLFKHYNEMGLNVDGLSYEQFHKQLLGKPRPPEDIIKDINSELRARGERHIEESTTVKDLAKTDDSRAIRDIYLYLSSVKIKIDKKANAASAAVVAQNEKLQEQTNQLQLLIGQHNVIKVIGKAAERLLRTAITAIDKNERKPSAVEEKVRDELLKEDSYKVMKLASLVKAIAGIKTPNPRTGVGEVKGFDFSEEGLSREDLANKITADSEVARVLNSISSDPALQKIAVDLMVSLGKRNQHIFDFASISQVKKEEQPHINKVLKISIEPSRTAKDRARAALVPLKGAARLAERLRIQVSRHQSRTKAIRKKLAIGNRMVEFRANTHRLMSSELSLLEEKMGMEWRVDTEGKQLEGSLFMAVEGAAYRVPTSAGQSSESLRENEVKTYTSSPLHTKKKTAEKYRTELKQDLAKITQWLNYPGRVKDAAYNYMTRVKSQLEGEVLPAEYTAGQQQFILKIFGTFRDEINRVGSPILNNLSRRISKYVSESERFKVLEKQIDAWTLSERDARDKIYGVDPMGKKAFRTHVYEPALNYFENHQEILQESESTEAAIEKALSRIELMFLNGGGELAAKMNSDKTIWIAIAKHLRETGKMSSAILNQSEEMGNRVREGSYFRKAVGAELFTVSRSISSSITLVVNQMRDLGWVKGVENVSDRHALGQGDPAVMEELRAEIIKRFDDKGAVWTKFVQAIAEVEGASSFLRFDNENSYVAREDVEAAFNSAGEGDLIAFAESLYDSTGGTPIVSTPEQVAEKAAYVSSVVNRFQKLFSGLNTAIDTHYDPETATGNFGTGIRRPMMDARKAEGFPDGWMEYSTFEEQSVLATMRALAANAAFGEKLRGFKSDIEASENEIKEHLDFKVAMDGNLTPLAQQKKEAIAEFGPAGWKMVLNAQHNLEQVGKIKKQVVGLISNDAKTYDLRTAHELLGAISGVVVQSVKTGIIDTSSLFAMPFAKYGFNTRAFIESAKGLNILREGVGSFFQAIGQQIDLDGGLHKIYNELNRGDPDALRNVHQRLVSSLSRDVMGASAADETGRFGQVGKIFEVSIAKTSRVLKELLSTGFMGFGDRGDPLRHATLKPLAPFTQIGQWMTAANTKNVWKSYRKLVQDATAYLQKNPEAERSASFRFNHKHVGMPKEAFEYMNNMLAEEGGMSLEALAQKAKDEIAIGAEPELFTLDQYRQLAVLAQTEITKETSALTRPTWVFTEGWGRATNPLVGWSIEKAADVERNFKLRNEVGELSLKLLMRSMAPYVAILPASLAFVWMRKEWEEEVVGKRPNMLDINLDMVMGKGEAFEKMSGLNRVNKGLLLPMLDQTTRAGMFGITGDFANTVLNQATGRDFHIENRVFFLSLIRGMSETMSTWVQSGTPLDWQNGFKPFLQAAGGHGYIESAQILQRTFGIDSDEVRITKRLNTDNWLRSVGRQLALDVQIPSGARGIPNPFKPHLKNMAIAAMSNDPIRFSQAKLEAEKELRRQGESEEEIVKKIKARFRDYHPARRIFKGLPTEKDYQNLINNIPEEHRAEVNNALELYNSYCERLGTSPFRGKEEKGTTKTSSRRSYRSSQQDILRQLYGQPSRSSGSRGGDSKNNRNDIMRKALGY